MVSEKMRELGTKKSTIREIFEYGRKRAQEVGEENICDFSLGNPNVPAPDFIKQAVLAIMTEMEPQAVHGYTIAPGNPAVRETLAASINERFGTHFSGKNLFMTALCRVRRRESSRRARQDGGFSDRLRRLGGAAFAQDEGRHRQFAEQSERRRIL